MAWPCITRACCINRFWTELDKADISVPLVFTKYSDVADVQHVQHHPQPRIKRPGPGPGSRPGPGPGETREPEQAAAGKPPPKDGSAASVMRQDFKAWRVRPEPSCKPRNEFQRSAAPFNNETQYQKDYKPWPIPKKHDHPWIPKASPTAGGGGGGGGGDGGAKMEPPETGVEKSEIEEKVQEKEIKEPVKAREKEVKEVKESKEPVKEKEVQLEEVQPPAGESSSEQKKGRAAADALNRHIKQNMTTASSYRTEFKAYKDVKPVKAIKAASQYQPPAAETTSRETSYSATYKGEQVKAASDNKMLERRRIRSLYNEPAGKDAAVAKADKPASRSKPKKTTVTTTTTAGKTAKKSKEKQPAAKKKATTPEPKPDGGVTKKSKEISNRLAEAKQ